jgi:hypothetical protein
VTTEVDYKSGRSLLGVKNEKEEECAKKNIFFASLVRPKF